MDTAEKRKIEAIEKELLSDKPWQLKGEVGAYSRPVNSLLFEDVNFEQRVKAPLITAETTETLEEMIKQRIKDNKFDDPEKKIKPTGPTQKSSKQVDVSDQRSKVGLATLYEQEIVAKAGGEQRPKDGVDKEIETKLYALFRKLDALVDR